MSLRCTTLKISICLFFPSWLFAQIPSFDTLTFYQHLKNEGLFIEQVMFAQKLRNSFSANQESKDSLTLEIAASYLKLEMQDSCRNNLKKISATPNFHERKKELFFSLLILSHEYEVAEKKLSSVNLNSFDTDGRISMCILKREQLKTDTIEKNISPRVLDFKNRYTNSPMYSPFLAGTFSAILPGAGKWYIGNKRQALTAFLANAMFAAQTVESYYKAGVSSPQFIFTAGIFSVFYAGNIWGSVLAAKKKKRDYLRELDYEILDHYHTHFTKLSH